MLHLRVSGYQLYSAIFYCKNTSKQINSLISFCLFLDKNLNVSNIKLNDRKEEIGQHNSQVQKLEETETPLKPTVDKADDLMAEKEQEHPDQHEQLKDGLNK